MALFLKHSLLRWVLLIGLVFLADRAGSAVPGNRRPVVQKDFRIFDYFRGSQRLKTLLYGAEAEYLSHPIPIREMTIETYAESGATNLIARAKESLCDRTNRTASSAGPLDIRLADDRFKLSGVGFLWTQTNTTLFVSNQVRSTLRGDLLRLDPLTP